MAMTRKSRRSNNYGLKMTRNTRKNKLSSDTDTDRSSMEGAASRSEKSSEFEAGQSTFAKLGSYLDPFSGKQLPPFVRDTFRGGKHEVIGEGGFGCVLRSASLPCMGHKSSNVDNHVSKILVADAAESELKRHNYVYDKFDKHLMTGKHFIMSPPKICNPNVKKLKAVDNCENGNTIIENSENYKILRMKYGGLSLSDLHKKNSTINWTRGEKMILLRSFQNIFEGVEKMIGGQYLHHDIKPQNILYDEKKKKLLLIDFGLARSVKDFVKKLRNSSQLNPRHKLRPGYHFSYPKEHHLMAEKNFNQFARLLRKTTLHDARQAINIFVGDEFEKSQRTFFKYSDDSYDYHHEVNFDTFNMIQAINKYIIDGKNSLANRSSRRDRTRSINTRSGKTRSGKLLSTNLSTRIKKLYDFLLKIHIQTFDTYALGFSLLYTLKNIFSKEENPNHPDSLIINNLISLSKKMCTSNLFHRILPKEASESFRDIIANVNIE